MQGYNNPTVYNISNPTGVDLAIARCQAKLSSISWLTTIYGRAYIQYAEDSATATQRGELKNVRNRSERLQRITFPETWGKNYEPVNLMPNDNIKGAQCFFVVRDPGVKANKGDSSQISMHQAISIIFWCNLQDINPSLKEKFSEQLKRIILGALNSEPIFEFDQHYERVDKIYESFTVLDTYMQYLKPPYWGIRIDGFLNYDVLPAAPHCCDDHLNDFFLTFNTDTMSLDAITAACLNAYLPTLVEMNIETNPDVNLLPTVPESGEDNLLTIPNTVLDLSKNTALQIIFNGVIVQNVAQDFTAKTLNFNSIDGVHSGILSILYRKKI